MNHPSTALVTATFSLLSVLSAQANIKISALPFTITAPGTYVLTGNLAPAPNSTIFMGGINIPRQYLARSLSATSVYETVAITSDTSFNSE
jgi:hypothetical protein